MSDAPLTVRTARYTLAVSADGMRASLGPHRGVPWLTLRPLAALDATDAPDETVAIEPPTRISERTLIVVRRSTRWARAWTRLICNDDSLEVQTGVEGEGRLATVRLLAVRSLLPGRAHGLLSSGSRLTQLFSPNPDRPTGPTRPLAEGARIGVVGDNEPGRGRWLFTPAPLYACLGDVGVSVVAPVSRLQFAELAIEGGDGAFDLALPYDGHERVQGTFEAPSIVLTPGVEDPYAGLRSHRELLESRGVAPPAATRVAPRWWTEPIFCGWGAQCARAAQSGRPAADHATQAEYDDDLELLARQDLEPGTIVLDDKWQRSYGVNEPDLAKWPDLRGWIARHHARGQRVLLWLKAWDPEGLAPDLCVCNPEGAPLALDPTAPAAVDHVARMMQNLLGKDGLDADGLKIDFTARTPSGTALHSHSGAWGIALAHEMLKLIHDAAKQTDPEALIVTQAPHPSFAGVSDMIRLNDILQPPAGEEAAECVVSQMRHRAAVTQAVCPELLIDTDDWCQPDLASWRSYLKVKPDLGVPALYYASQLETGERLADEDYAALRAAWESWRSSRA